MGRSLTFSPSGKAPNIKSLHAREGALLIGTSSSQIFVLSTPTYSMELVLQGAPAAPLAQRWGHAREVWGVCALGRFLLLAADSCLRGHAAFSPGGRRD